MVIEYYREVKKVYAKGYICFVGGKGEYGKGGGRK